MTRRYTHNGNEIITFSWAERAVGSILGLLLVAALGFIGRAAWETRDAVLGLGIKLESAIKVVDDHEGRIRALEKHVAAERVGQ